MSTPVGTPVDFSVATRLADAGVTYAYTWRIQGPGYPTPTVVEGPPDSDNAYTHSFVMLGTYTLTCELAVSAFVPFVSTLTKFLSERVWTVNVAGSAPESGAPFEPFGSSH